MYKTPKFGKQTVQEYHPERGANFHYQVSTYARNGWHIRFCSVSGLEAVKRAEKDRIYTDYQEPY